MSQADMPQFVSIYGAVHVDAVVELVASTLLFYDYILTFLREVKYVWQRRLSGVMVVFLLNRYVVMSNRVVRLIQLKSWDGFTILDADYFCILAWRWSEASTILMYISIACFSAFQTYAIYGKDKRVFFILVISGALNPILNIYYITSLSFLAIGPPFTGCAESETLSESTNLDFRVLMAVSTIISEVVVLALLWRRLAGNLSILRKLKVKTSCTTLLWRDGTVYFVTLIVLTTLSLLSISSSLQGFENIPALTDTLASMCLSRYILHLRATRLDGGTSNTSVHLSHMSDLRFTHTRPALLDPVDIAVDGWPQLPSESTHDDVC